MTERDLEKENAELRAKLQKFEEQRSRRNESQKKHRESSPGYKERRRVWDKKYREKDLEAYKAKRKEQARLRKEREERELGDIAGAMVNW